MRPGTVAQVLLVIISLQWPDSWLVPLDCRFVGAPKATSCSACRSAPRLTAVPRILLGVSPSGCQQVQTRLEDSQLSGICPSRGDSIRIKGSQEAPTKATAHLLQHTPQAHTCLSLPLDDVKHMPVLKWLECCPICLSTPDYALPVHRSL